jgi:hypothetical protein
MVQFDNTASVCAIENAMELKAETAKSKALFWSTRDFAPMR